MPTFDVVVVGGGVSGGLPAAAYLQKAGARVCLIEARHELGTFIPTHEIWPEVLTSPHAAINFSAASPAIEDLELEKYGYQLRFSPVIFGVTDRDGKNALVYYDAHQTAKNFAKHSARDSRTIEEAQSQLPKILTTMNELLFFSPHPNAEKFEKGLEVTAAMAKMDVSQLMEMSGPELVESMFESDPVRRVFMTLPALHLQGDPMARGQGAVSILWSLFYTAAIAKGGNFSLVNALERCFIEHGGTILRNCPVDRIVVRNGRATGVVLSKEAVFPGKRIDARKAVVSNLSAKKTIEVLGQDTMMEADPRLAMKMKYWKSSGRASTVHNWILKGHPRWKSANFDPNIQKALLFYRAWDRWDDFFKWEIAVRKSDNRAAMGGMGEILDFSAVDPAQASPEGYVNVRCEHALSFWWRGEDGIGYWDKVRDEVAEFERDLFEELAPGFKSQIVEELVTTPLDIWRYNQVAYYGQVLGGDFTEDQWILDRMPYRMPIDGLYMSNGVWPLALSWMAPGYNAATVVAEDLGVRKQPWWTHRPGQWFLNNLERYTAR